MTYESIIAEVRRRYRVYVRTCWIAHVKELNGLPVRRAWNRKGNNRDNPCPEKYRGYIEEVMGVR